MNSYTITGVYLSSYDTFVHHIDGASSEDALRNLRVRLGKTMGLAPDSFADYQDFEDTVNDDVIFTGVFRGTHFDE